MTVQETFTQANSVLFSFFGMTATYTPAGGSPTEITIVPNREYNGVINGYDVKVVEFFVKKSEVEVPGEGDTVVYGSYTWRVRDYDEDFKIEGDEWSWLVKATRDESRIPT